MRRVASSSIKYPAVLASDLEQIFQLIQGGSWKVSGCGLGQGAFSCALFMSQYSRMSKQVDLSAEIQDLFDRGCNSVVSGKTCWLDFADLALVAQRLNQQGFIQIEQEVFFEDIDKLALSEISEPALIAGFENSDLGAALYAYRRLNAGALHFSEPVKGFAAALVSGVDPAILGSLIHTDHSLRNGLSAPMLFVSVVAENGLVDKKKGMGGITTFVERVCESVHNPSSNQINPGFQTGELGKGYALLRAGMCFQWQEWIATGLQISMDCACYVLDQGISTLDMASGGSGIALAFDKLHRLSGYDIFRKAASNARWLSLKAAVIMDDRNIDHGYSFYHGLSGMGLATLHWQGGQLADLDEFLWLL